VAVSFDREVGLFIVSALYCFEILSISSSSLVTITLSMYFELSPASILQDMSGFPPISSTFFLGNHLLPPRARIIAKKVLFLYIS